MLSIQVSDLAFRHCRSKVSFQSIPPGSASDLLLLSFGTFLGNVVMFGVHLRTDSLVWMLPIGLQFIFPAVIAMGSMFLPESPRVSLHPTLRHLVD